jgi:5'-nucleotidase
MTTSYDNSSILDHFTVGNPSELAQKLQRLNTGGSERIHYLFDFDRTLTTSSHFGKDVTTWDLLDGLIPKEARAAYDPISKHYQNLEFEGKLSEADAFDWWACSFEFYIQHGMKLDAIHKTLGQLKIRKGAQELFALCEKNNIPTIILSAGIGDVIDILMQEHDMKPTAIISNKLHFAADGQLIGWDADSLTHVLNKYEKGHVKLSTMRSERPFTILVGDSVEDARMVRGTDDVLRIRVGDRLPHEKPKWEQYLQTSFNAGFDLVANQEDLLPLVELTGWLVDPVH